MHNLFKKSVNKKRSNNFKNLSNECITEFATPDQTDGLSSLVSSFLWWSMRYVLEKGKNNASSQLCSEVDRKKKNLPDL